MRYFVHDFLLEQTSTNEVKDCFFYHVTLYCTHEKEWIEEENEKFFVSVGNPEGIAHHLQIMGNIISNDNQRGYFNGPMMTIKNFNQKEVIALLTDKIQCVVGKSKGELLYKLSPYFEWEYLGDDWAMKSIF